MSYSKCNYVDCSNVIKKRKCKFYKFPINDSERCEKWKLSCGNLKLFDVPDEQLRMMHVCENHFSHNSFVNESHHRLIQSAVPIPYTDPTPAFIISPFQIESETPSHLASSSSSPKSLSVRPPQRVYLRKRLFSDKSSTKSVIAISPKKRIESVFPDIVSPPKISQFQRQRNLYSPSANIKCDSLTASKQQSFDRTIIKNEPISSITGFEGKLSCIPTIFEEVKSPPAKKAKADNATQVSPRRVAPSKREELHKKVKNLRSHLLRIRFLMSLHDTFE